MALPKPSTVSVGETWRYKSMHGNMDYEVTDVVSAQQPCHPGMKDHVHLKELNSTAKPRPCVTINELLNLSKWAFEKPANGTVNPAPMPVLTKSKSPVAPYIPVQIATAKKYIVSMNGRDWVRYELLDDSDPVEKYPHHREV